VEIRKQGMKGEKIKPSANIFLGRKGSVELRKRRARVPIVGGRLL
jgi:hypothetical protein